MCKLHASPTNTSLSRIQHLNMVIVYFEFKNVCVLKVDIKESSMFRLFPVAYNITIFVMYRSTIEII